MTQYWQTLSYFAYTQGIIFNKYFKGVQCWLVILADKGTLEGFCFLLSNDHSKLHIHS